MPDTRSPYDHTLHAINELNQHINGIASMPSGGPRPLDSHLTGALNLARAQITVASALLAVADAIREHQAGGQS